MKIVVKIIVVAFALLFAAKFVPGIAVSSFGIAVVVAIVLGVINTVIRPILFVLTLPITLITLGLFALVLNVILFWVAALLVPGFEVQGIVAAILGSLIVSAAHTIAEHLLKD